MLILEENLKVILLNLGIEARLSKDAETFELVNVKEASDLILTLAEEEILQEVAKRVNNITGGAYAAK